MNRFAIERPAVFSEIRAVFCNLEDLKNESDVESKLIMPILSRAEPEGCGYWPAEIYTKANIRFLSIEKGRAEKIYRPDYIILISGLPIVVIEAKRPDESLEDALREARLYAAELNALHPPGINPCSRVMVSNGKEIRSSPSDSTVADVRLDFTDINLGSQLYHELLSVLKRSATKQRAEQIRSGMKARDHYRPIDMIGGETSQRDEIGYNRFGRQLSHEFLHVFDPRTREERANVVRNAYVPSRRREHYVDEIDRVIRTSLPSPLPGSTVIQDTTKPTELVKAFSGGRDLQNRLFILVGPVGSGKSTFVDYFREVKLPQDVAKTMVWISVDINEAPVGKEMMERWIVDEIITKLKGTQPDLDFDTYKVQQNVFSVEMEALRKGALMPVSPESPKYGETISDEIRKLLADNIGHAKALARYLSSERGKLLVVVFDNCDKGDLVEQLMVFQIVRWVQSWLRCLVFLPIRDVTYRTCKDRPPLDTAIKEFVFLIENPPFADVLRRRIQLALNEMQNVDRTQRYEFTLDSSIRIVYPASQLGLYLASICKTLYEHDRLLRRMLVGLAGKNIRKAMEIFLDFCKSGHIKEAEFLKIRASHGNHTLPKRVVMRVLLRLSKRYYDGEISHLKNVFHCDPGDTHPDYFVRFAILKWLEERFRTRGPSGVQGFHRAERLISELVPFGHAAERVRQDLHYLIRSMLVLTEHQRTKDLSDNDLICLSPAGFAHLSMVATSDYLAACSEDTWYGDQRLAETIADRIGHHGAKYHYSRQTTVENASDFVGYLSDQLNSEVAKPFNYLERITEGVSGELSEIRKSLAEKQTELTAASGWSEVEGKFTVGQTYPGRVIAVKDFGVFVRVDNGPTGLLHITKIPSNVRLDSLIPRQTIRVKLLSIDAGRNRMELGYAL